LVLSGSVRLKPSQWHPEHDPEALPVFVHEVGHFVFPGHPRFVRPGASVMANPLEAGGPRPFDFAARDLARVVVEFWLRCYEGGVPRGVSEERFSFGYRRVVNYFGEEF